MRHGAQPRSLGRLSPVSGAPDTSAGHHPLPRRRAGRNRARRPAAAPFPPNTAVRVARSNCGRRTRAWGSGKHFHATHKTTPPPAELRGENRNMFCLFWRSPRHPLAWRPDLGNRAPLLDWMHWPLPRRARRCDGVACTAAGRGMALDSALPTSKAPRAPGSCARISLTPLAAGAVPPGQGSLRCAASNSVVARTATFGNRCGVSHHV